MVLNDQNVEVGVPAGLIAEESIDTPAAGEPHGYAHVFECVEHGQHVDEACLPQHRRQAVHDSDVAQPGPT